MSTNMFHLDWMLLVAINKLSVCLDGSLVIPKYLN